MFVRTVLPLVVLLLSAGNANAMMPEQVCQRLKEKNPKTYETLVNHGRCEGAQAQAVRDAANAEIAAHAQERYTIKAGTLVCNNIVALGKLYEAEDKNQYYNYAKQQGWCSRPGRNLTGLRYAGKSGLGVNGQLITLLKLSDAGNTYVVPTFDAHLER